MSDCNKEDRLMGKKHNRTTIHSSR